VLKYWTSATWTKSRLSKDLILASEVLPTLWALVVGVDDGRCQAALDGCRTRCSCSSANAGRTGVEGAGRQSVLLTVSELISIPYRR